MTLRDERFGIGDLKLRGRLFRLWIVLSFVATMGWLAISGPELLALIKADSISCFPVASGKLLGAGLSEGPPPMESDSSHNEGNGGAGSCDRKTFRFGDLSQPQKEVAIRINHINVFDARATTFKLFEIDRLNADQRDQLTWYFQDKAARRRRDVDFLLIYILGPIFGIPIALLICIRAFRWVNRGH